jgi:NAD(P)-dependent dehydrogenase (short-subunit alcohol dehydrogenase family)
VALASRRPDRLAGLVAQTGARSFMCDASDKRSVEALFQKTDDAIGPPDVVLFNASYRYRGPVLELDPLEVQEALRVGAFGGFLVAQEAAKRMLARKAGTLLFTGASASVKGFAGSVPFAMQKFALRGLAQSLARELAPQGVHVVHLVVDGRIRPAGAEDPDGSMLDPDAIAATMAALVAQERSAWTWEVELRPWGERW